MKYSEANDRRVFDWNQFLDQAEHSYSEIFKAFSLSGDWVTCAVGQQCDVIPRERGHTYKKGEPIDGWLRRDGYAFHKQIKKMYDTDYEETYQKARLKAIEILNRIEVRSAVLIKRYSN